MKIDFLIPASLTDGFCGQVAFFRMSLDALGPPYSDARLVVVFGDPPTEELPPHWRRHFDRIGVEWAYNPDQVSRENYARQHWRRFEIFRPDCDLVVMCDADVAQLRPMDGLARQLIDEAAIGGVIAHYHFSWPGREKIPEVDWPELSQKVLGTTSIDLPYRYTLLPPDSPPQAPFYINYGVLMAPPDVLSALYQSEMQIIDKVAQNVGRYWAPQISVALSCARVGLTCKSLPMRYNFPNDPTADGLYPEEMQNIIFMHYLRERHFNRNKIFADSQAFDAFMTAELYGSNEIFRHHVTRLTGGTFPFPG